MAYSSDAWRIILYLRDAAWYCINHCIRDGNVKYLWINNWHPFGSLLSNFGNRIIYYFSILLNDKVTAVVKNFHSSSEVYVFVGYSSCFMWGFISL